MRIALYARVSTTEQANHGLSIATQLDNLRQWAEREGHAIVGEYVDPGISARKSPLKRPALQTLLQHLDGLDAVCFTKLDRWTRNIKGYYSVQEQLDKAGVAWVAIQEDYETVTASGRFKVNIMLSVAENEADRTSERIKVVFDRKVALSEHLGPKPPLGYSVTNKHLTPDAAAPVAREAFRQFQLTGSTSVVMDYLHSQGYMYNYTSVDHLLRNEMYAGRYRGNLAYCPPLIPPAEFDEIQRQLANRSVRRNQTKREYLFSGLIYCAECGKRCAGVFRANVREDKQYQYRCNTHYHDHLCPNKILVKESEIEDYLLSKLEHDVASFTGSRTAPTPTPPDNTSKLERLTDLYVDGLITKEDYITRRDALTSPPPPAPVPVPQIVLSGDFRKEYGNLTRIEKRAIWRSVVDRIEMGDDVVITFLL